MKANSSLVPLVLENVREGDILFLRIPRFLFRKVAEASNSWTNHVGIILKREGQWVVAESAIPKVRFSPLEKFIARSQEGYLLQKRLKGGLTENQVQTIHQEAEKRLGTWYHLGFDLDSKKVYCSKFVYQVYRAATGLEIGRVQRFRDLLNEHPSPKRAKRFWTLYYFGFIPWDRRTVTPATQMADEKLETIFEGAAIQTSFSGEKLEGVSSS